MIPDKVVGSVPLGGGVPVQEHVVRDITPGKPDEAVNLVIDEPAAPVILHPEGTVITPGPQITAEFNGCPGL